MNAPTRNIDVVAGVIRRADGRILICLRPRHLDQGGLWEFPGGKREAGETRFGALARELREELNIEIENGAPLLRLKHDYPDKTVDLDVWEVTRWQGNEKGMEGQSVRWVLPDELKRYEFPAANTTIISAAMLPRVVLLMPGRRAAQESFFEQLKACLEGGIRTVVQRPLEDDSDLELHMAMRAARLCEKFGATFLAASSKAVVDRVGAAGLHLSCSRLRQYSSRPLGPRHFVSASCEDADDLAHAAQIGVDFVLFVPPGSASEYEDCAIGDWDALADFVAHSTLPAYICAARRPIDLERSIGAGFQGLAMTTRDSPDCAQRIMEMTECASRAAESFRFTSV